MKNTSVILSGTKWSRRISLAVVLSVFLFAACDDSSTSAESGEPSVLSSSLGRSSSSANTSSSETAVKPCDAQNDKNCFEDKRDGKTYRTVKIGSQVWMAENLNYESINSSCYEDKKDNCAKYGRLYTWGAAIDSIGKFSKNGVGCGNRIDSTPIYPVRGICPEGWHLPDTTEWRVLIDLAGGEDVAGKALKSKSGWKADGNGTDELGFAGIPVGGRFGGSFGGEYFDEGIRADYWTSSTDYHPLGNAIDVGLDAYRDEVFMGVISLRVGSSDRGYSIRCLKND